VKRFWKKATAEPRAEGWTVLLDGREVRTPKRAPLLVPGERLAEAIRNEWANVGETIEPRALPLTGLANAAIDHATPDPAAFAAPLARYGEGDLLCYRADAPEPLVRAQAEAWDPLLAWASHRYDAEFRVVTGVVHTPQPPHTVRRLAAAVGALDPFRLVAMNPLVTIGGSLVAALALLEGETDEEGAWDATQLDDIWQAEKWGEDAEALAMREGRRRAWAAAAQLLSLLP